jgi:hypothetical protein
VSVLEDWEFQITIKNERPTMSALHSTADIAGVIRMSAKGQFLPHAPAAHSENWVSSNIAG